MPLNINVRFIKRIGLHLLYWVVFTFSYTFFSTVFFSRGALTFEYYKFQLLANLHGHFYLIPSAYLIAYILIPKLLQRGRIVLFILSIPVLLVFLAFLDDIINIYYFIPKYRPDYTETFTKYLAYKPTHLFIVAIMLFAQLIIFISVKYIKSYLYQAIEKEKLKTKVYETELEVLKNQINPHFLFNVLNNLYSLAIENEDEVTADGISKLSSLMRYNIYTKKDTKVPLEDEIESKTIAPFIFIMFIENAFKYGISLNKKSDIHIKLKTVKDQIRFEIMNNNNRPDNKLGGGIGLENVKQRLEHFYPNKHKLIIEDTDKEYKVFLEIKD